MTRPWRRFSGGPGRPTTSGPWFPPSRRSPGRRTDRGVRRRAARPRRVIRQGGSRDRVVTQTSSRALFEEGVAGIRFRSNLDDGPCAALFEGRARLDPRGEPASLTEDVEELLQVCGEYGLVVRR